MVAAEHPARLQFVQRPAHRGERRGEAGRERVEVGVLMLADVVLDEVEALLVGHAGAGAWRSRAKRSR